MNAVDRLIEIDKQISALKKDAAALEAELLSNAEHDLAATKCKTVRYYGNDNNCAVITMAQSVKAVYESMLPSLFGKAYKDMVNEKTSYTLTAAAKRLLAGLYLRDYSCLSVNEVLEQIPASAEQLLSLSKKLKGKNPATDAKQLRNIAGLNAEDADLYAYFIQEAAIWQERRNIIKLNGWTEEDAVEKILDKVDAAIVVEETPKITLICEDEE